WRHLTLITSHPPSSRTTPLLTRRHPTIPSTSHLPSVYYLYVLGSGGHTSELLETIKHKSPPTRNTHRRYLLNTGDTSSLTRLAKLEALITDAFPDGRAGTFDAFRVPRARRVHQPFWTAPLTCLGTALAVINALTREPDARLADGGGLFRFPHVIVTNGPATGFIVALVAHLLKMFFLAPKDRLRVVYIESWARTRTLSLTGKLVLWTGIADMFCVQHRALGERYKGWGVVYVGVVAARLAPRG
ncbi:glycosyltransferase, partial [Staphylotrichum tortipilum]